MYFNPAPILKLANANRVVAVWLEVLTNISEAPPNILELNMHHSRKLIVVSRRLKYHLGRQSELAIHMSINTDLLNSTTILTEWLWL